MEFRNKDYVKLLENFRISANSKNIDNIEEIERDIVRLYPKEKDIYVELSNYYTRNNQIKKSIQNLEKYKENGGKNIEVLILLCKQYIEMNYIQEVKILLNNISIKNKHNKEINDILYIISMRENESPKKNDNEQIEKINHITIKYNKNLLENIFSNDNFEYYINQLLYTNKNIVNKILYDLFLKSIFLNLSSKDKIIKFVYLQIKYYFAFDYIVKKSEKSRTLHALIDFICYLIEFDDKDYFLIEYLSKILDNTKFDKDIKKNIIEILMKHFENSRTIKTKNIFLNEAEILQNKTNLLSKPREVHITLTLKCNLRCIMCCNGYNHEYEIDDNFYNYLIDNMKYFNKIIWIGGECFLYKKFVKILEVAAKYNIKQIIITNGLLLNEKYINILVKSKIDLSISIDAVDKNLYEKIRVGGNFEKLLNNLKLLKTVKEKNSAFNYNMNVVLMTNNYKQIENFVDFALSYGFDGISFLDCDINKEIHNEYLVLNKEQIEDVHRQYAKLINKRHNINLNIDFDIPLKLIRDKNINGNKCERKTEKFSENSVTFGKYNRTESFGPSNVDKSRLFCNLPWRRLILNENNISFGCQCRTIDISNYSICEDDVWNVKELINYRKSILDYREKSCKIFLENNC